MTDRHYSIGRLLFGGILLGGMFGMLLPAATGRAQPTGPIGLDALEQFHRISEMRQGARAYQYSSHERSGRNQDWRGDLGIVNGERILLDVKGPGCIDRMWFTGHDPSEYIRIYFDGASTPLVEMTLDDFFSGTQPPFLAPLVGNETVSSGGFYCYVPMVFREGCRITSSSIDGLNYYNITFHRFSTADGLVTFTGQEDVSAARDVWNTAGADPKTPATSTLLETSVGAAAGQAVTLADLDFPGVVQSFELIIPGLNETILSSLWLHMYWDDADEPAVEAPLGPFFGSGLGPAPVNALPMGIDGDRLYCYFPMPFDSSARIELVNEAGEDVNGVQCSLSYTMLTEPPPGVGQFYAHYRRVPHPTPGNDYVFLDVAGAGHLVGVVQTLRGYSDSEWYLEGDERIYIDGSRTPALYGTGTEDFYNGGWYFREGPFTLPLHGNPASIDSGNHAHTCYRFFMGDAIPFTSHIRAGIEHGGWNNYDVDLETVAFYYRTPFSLSRVTDEVDVGDAASEQAHDYQITGTAYTDEKTWSYEGDNDHHLINDTGRRLAGGSRSTFTVRVWPPNHAGLLLRRRLDYSIPRQEAYVYVDGQFAGTWYDAGSNGFWADSEFMIPASLAEGQDEVVIEIENVSPESDWTEYAYEVMTLLPPPPAATGDFDYDGDVDQSDFAHFQLCLTGSFVAQHQPICWDTKLDQDEDVDSADLAILLECMSGADVPADHDCDP